MKRKSQLFRERRSANAAKDFENILRIFVGRSKRSNRPAGKIYRAIEK